PLVYYVGEIALSLTSPKRFGDYQVMLFDVPYPAIPLSFSDTPNVRNDKWTELEKRVKSVGIYQPNESMSSEGQVEKDKVRQHNLTPVTFVFDDTALVRAGEMIRDAGYQ